MDQNVTETNYAPAPAGPRDPLGLRLIAATAAVLHRYTDRAELTIGYAIDGAEPSVTLRVDTAGEASFAELLGRVNTALAATDGHPSHVSPDTDAVVGLDREPPVESRHDQGLLGEHVRTLLAAASGEPDEAVAALGMLSDRERDQLLVAWNDTAAPYPGVCVQELIAEHARATPDTIAVQFGEEKITYAELDARSNQLARHLVGIGVGPEALVGICVERSAQMVIGLLGILKAGGAYVPIDPAYPAERKQYMLTNSEAPVILTEERLRASLPVGDARVVCIDTDWSSIAGLATGDLDVTADAEQLAYVIYTSGSTGNPKGVQIPHRALVNFLTTIQRTPGLAPDDVLVAVTTLSFDIAGLELYLPLITGSRVVIAPAETAADPKALAVLLAGSGATIMQATPTTWRMLIDSGWPGRVGMKALCGGEALPQALADRLVGLGLELWNMYGPTETTIWSTCAPVRTQGKPLSIGHPIANTTLYILDERMQPVPVGVAGELWIGGDGLARGYRGRPDLTDERFVAHPFDSTPGARIYKTGDLARYRPDGTVDFLGRIDHQVKVRGFRIELGEIETVLTRHPGIADAVVVARGSDADAELAAYVIATEAPVSAVELRQFLARTLPAYMVPSTVTPLDAFPLTPNGKVDRKALPEPARTRSGEHELVAPRTPLEQRLTAIWERELKISPIGVTDNFFDLGVTSIVAATLFAAIEHDLSDSLPLGAIFRAPTIAALVELIESDDGVSRRTSLVPIQPEGTKPPIFCVHGGAGTILHLASLARRLGADQPFYGLQSSGLYGGSPPPRTVEEMAAHYIAEMRQVHPCGPWYLAGYCFGTLVAFEMAQSLLAQGEDVQLLAMFNGPSPAWIRKWGWYGNQLSHRQNRPRAPRMTRQQRLRRALRDPDRFRTALIWNARRAYNRRRAQLALRLRRPLPEELREQFFFGLHFDAERAYEPVPYARDMLVFHGEGLYEDPELGWGGLAAGGVTTYAVPGEHRNNRQAMAEPAVGFVSERIREYLAQR